MSDQKDQNGGGDTSERRDSLHAESPTQTHCAPALQPRQVWPRCYSQPLTFLKKVDRIELSEVKMVKHVAFYVLDVYIRHPVSHIPTNNRQLQTEPQQQRQQQPDFRVKRRFRDFDALRQRVIAASQQQLLTTCAYCDSIRVFMFGCYGRPTAYVKLCTGPEERKKLLTHFINRLIQFAVGHPKANVNTCPRGAPCPGFQAIPELVDHFVRHRCYFTD